MFLCYFFLFRVIFQDVKCKLKLEKVRNIRRKEGKTGPNASVAGTNRRFLTNIYKKVHCCQSSFQV